MTKRVLIIDDEPSTLKVLKRSLELNHYRVSLASNGRDGIEQALKNKPDAILLDIIMPELDGWQVLEFLKANEKTEDVPVIMLTGRGLLADVEKSYSMGARDYILKPFQLRKVREKIDKALEECS